MKKSVLIIDDEVALTKGLERLLRKDFIVSTSNSVSGALEEISRKCPDCLLLDIRMPVQGGIELLTHVKLKWPGLPSVVMTGGASMGEVQNILNLGASGYIEKPLNIDYLKVILQNSIEGKSDKA